jgi:hypothetical protein
MTNNYNFKNPVVMRCKVIDHVFPNTYEFKLTSFKSTKLKKKPRRILLDSITLSDKKVNVFKRNLRLAINENRLSMYSEIKNGNMLYPYWVYDESWNRVL